MRERFLLPAMVLLGACATTSQPQLNEPPRNVDSAESRDFWVLEAPSFNLPVPAGMTPRSDCGYVNLGFLIDSNGEVFDVELIDSVPRSGLDQVTQKKMEAMTYEPAIGNPDRIPIRTNIEITFDMDPNDGVECDDLIREARSKVSTHEQ